MSATIHSLLQHVIIAFVIVKEFANVPASSAAYRFEEETVNQGVAPTTDGVTPSLNNPPNFQNDAQFNEVKGLLDKIKPLVTAYADTYQSLDDFAYENDIEYDDRASIQVLVDYVKSESTLEAIILDWCANGCTKWEQFAKNLVNDYKQFEQFFEASA
eukprot:TRINITY_DN30451_c0_g1_i1.p1 TRINITY_DN30451_c0_g1~~TRINITY_DN30451_c0_g1_i1.p1  ORF type:complete len:158 (-),score=26.52 TRINITY_DN30451_c0_g1_i1:238-711(-)